MQKDIRTLLQTASRATQCALGIFTNATYQYEGDEEDDMPEAPPIRENTRKGEETNAGKDVL